MTTNKTACLVAMMCGAIGCGRQLVGVSKPEALVDWSPKPHDSSAQITAVGTGGGRIYVGFSDGDMFFQSDAGGGWANYGQGPYGGCGQSIPKGPVTAFAITYATTFVAYAGTPGAPGIWRSPADRPCWAQEPMKDEFLSLSVSPFSSIELIALGEGLRWVSSDLGGDWSEDAAPRSLNFAGDALAVASGLSPAGAPRAWLGDREGHVYFSDDGATATSPDQISWQPVTPDPGFPNRPVVAISVVSDRPSTIWITFSGVAADSLWTSDDAGQSWRNPHGGALPTAEPSGADAGQGQPVPAFAGVSAIPGTSVVVVPVLVPDASDTVTARSFWNEEGSDEWWPM
ncbi:MAG TPA: hypothetical protein VN962_16670 [Polyangia bacterium]|nr:hypothetical protein [Polyangia bacterium]